MSSPFLSGFRLPINMLASFGAGMGIGIPMSAGAFVPDSEVGTDAGADMGIGIPMGAGAFVPDSGMGTDAVCDTAGCPL